MSAAAGSKPPRPPTQAEMMHETLERLTGATEVQVRLLEVQERRELERERRERDSRGHRSELRKLPFLAYVRACPELAEAFERKIPSQFWSLDSGVAEISCPCGETPRSELGQPVRCDCARHYLYDGEAVRVAGGPNAPKSEPDAAPEPEADLDRS